MASTATMQGIWGMLKTLYLTSSNERWLAEKLIVSAAEKEKACSKEDQRILDGFRQAVRELKDGSIKTIPHDEAMALLRKELEAEGYEPD